jgi:hypothetical protein
MVSRCAICGMPRERHGDRHAFQPVPPVSDETLDRSKPEVPTQKALPSKERLTDELVARLIEWYEPPKGPGLTALHAALLELQEWRRTGGRSADCQRSAPETPAPLSERPAAWIRGHVTPGGEWGPAEYDEEVAPGPDCPAGKGWTALYPKQVKTTSPQCDTKCFDWPKCECGRGMP